MDEIDDWNRFDDLLILMEEAELISYASVDFWSNVKNSCLFNRFHYETFIVMIQWEHSGCDTNHNLNLRVEQTRIT